LNASTAIFPVASAIRITAWSHTKTSKVRGKDSIENSDQVEFKAYIPLKFMSNSQLFVITAKSFLIGNFLFREEAASL